MNKQEITDLVTRWTKCRIDKNISDIYDICHGITYNTEIVNSTFSLLNTKISSQIISLHPVQFNEYNYRINYFINTPDSEISFMFNLIFNNNINYKMDYNMQVNGEVPEYVFDEMSKEVMLYILSNEYETN
jgi:hypothetical protein